MSALLKRIGLALDPAAWAQRALGFEPDPHQISILETPERRILINCCRQWGKSTTVAAKALHAALFRDNFFAIAMSPTMRQTAELIRKLRTMLANLDIDSGTDGHNPLSISLPNRSRILGLPAVDTSLRGFSAVDLLIVDEAARVPDTAYRAARPFLARARDGGSIILLSTPWGQRGFFFHAWQGTSSDGNHRTATGWLRIKVPASECSRVSPEFLADERRELPDIFFRQDYCCEFAPAEGQLFTEEMLQAACDNTLVPIFGHEGWIPPSQRTDGGNEWLWKGTVEVNRQIGPHKWIERIK